MRDFFKKGISMPFCIKGSQKIKGFLIRFVSEEFKIQCVSSRSSHEGALNFSLNNFSLMELKRPLRGFFLDEKVNKPKAESQAHEYQKNTRIHNGQDCIPLCCSFSRILNKIKLTAFKQNFVLNGFASKELRSRNARSIDLDTAYQLAIAKGVDFQHREDFNPMGIKAEGSTFSVSDSDVIGKKSTRIRNLKGLERQDASKSTQGFGPLAYYKGLGHSGHEESKGYGLSDVKDEVGQINNRDCFVPRNDAVVVIEASKGYGLSDGKYEVEQINIRDCFVPRKDAMKRSQLSIAKEDDCNEEKDDVIKQVEVSDLEKDKYDDDNLLCTDHLESYLVYLEHQIYQHQLRTPYEIQEEGESMSKAKRKRMSNRPVASSRRGKKLRSLQEAINNSFNTLRYIPLTIYSKQAFLNLMLLFSFFAVSPAFGQEPVEVKPLQIGDTIPEALWDIPLQVVNHPEGKDSIRLRDYRDKKLIILDFWATWCGACIHMFDKTETLQSMNKDNLVILPITYEHLSKVEDFFRRRLNNRQSVFFSVYNEHILQQAFVHKMLPHYVWIDSHGVFIGASNGDQITQEHLDRAVVGRADFTQKVDVRIPYDKTKGILHAANGVGQDETHGYTFFGKYKNGLSAGSQTGKLQNGMNRITYLNGTLTSLLSTAYSRSDLFFGKNRIRYLGNDSTLFNIPKDDHELAKWRVDNLFCYEIIGKDAIGTLRQYMQIDIGRYFPQFDIKTKIVRQPCWVMKGNSDHPKLKSKGGKPQSSIDLNSCILKNSSLFNLFFNMNFYLFQNAKIPMQYEVIGDEPIDMEFYADMTNIEDINIKLLPYGIQFVLEDREVEMIVVEDKPKKGATYD